MLQIKNRAILDQWKLLSIVKGWSMAESTIESNDNPEIYTNNEIDDVKRWIAELVDRLIDKSVDMSERRNRFRLLDELRVKSNALHDEWSNIKVTINTNNFYVY